MSEYHSLKANLITRASTLCNHKAMMPHFMKEHILDDVVILS